MILRTYAELATAISARMRDVAAARWSATELAACLNRAVEAWQGRVGVWCTWDIAGGWASDSYELAVPDWMPDGIRVQLQWGSQNAQPIQWNELRDWVMEPTTAGGRVIRAPFITATMGLPVAARLLYWAVNGAQPTEQATLSSTITAAVKTATASITLPNVAGVGWVKIHEEWIQYQGLSRGASTTGLLNLVRGLQGTTAASHTASAEILWGVGAPQATFFDQLLDQACANLHELYLNDASPKERDIHERMISYYQNRADMFWRRMAPTRSPRIKPVLF